jgi:holo-[acyl-carrier protein] synthase
VSAFLPDDDGVVASALEVLDIGEVRALLARPGGQTAFTPLEMAYATARADPERRLAARLAAKRATCRALGGGTTEEDVEVLRDRYGPPSLRLSPRAQARMGELGASRALVSLTHERRHAAALVLLVRERS